MPAAMYPRSKPRVHRGVTKASVPARDRPLLSCTNLPLHAVTFGSSPSQKPPHTLPPRHHFQPFIRLAVAQFLVYHPVVNSGIKLIGYLVQKREQCPAQHPPILPTGAEERCPSRMRTGLSCSCTRVARGGQAPKENQAKPNPTNTPPGPPGPLPSIGRVQKEINCGKKRKLTKTPLRSKPWM